jgi:hypothetical protein
MEQGGNHKFIHFNHKICKGRTLRDMEDNIKTDLK